MFYGVLCILMWGLIPVVSVLGMNDLDYYQFLFWSSLTSFVTLLLLTIQKRQTQHLKINSFKQWMMLLFLGLLGTFFYYLCLYKGYQYGSKIEVLSVQYTWPAWVIVFALFFSKQVFRWHHGLVILAGISSVLLVISKGDFTQLSVPNIELLLWVLLGVTAFALFSVLSKQVDIPALPANTIFFAVATFASFITLTINSSMIIPDLESALPVLINGVIVNGVSYYFWLKALKQVRAEYLSLLSFMTPLVSMIYLVLIFSDPFYLIYLLAFGLIAVSGGISVIQNRKVMS